MYTLDFLLDKYDLTREQYHKKGRVSKEISQKRRQIVTFLHQQGLTWKEMSTILEKSTSFIQRNTDAMWNPESRKNSSRNGTRTGKMWKGKSRGDQLKRQWEKGDFDSLVGRSLPEEHVQNMKDSWTEERRKEKSEQMKKVWERPGYRTDLLEYHRSPQERKKRSIAQSRRIEENPEKWTRGRGSYQDVKRCTNGDRIWVRSSYETKALEILEDHDNVLHYTYELLCEDSQGHFRPDFFVTYKDGNREIIEVKSYWVLNLPKDHKVKKRLKRSKTHALSRNWGFQIWTEEELGL